VTDCNAAIFDVARLHGVICGCHEILRRQGLLERLVVPRSERTARSRPECQEIDRVCRTYRRLIDDAFVRQNIARWLA